MKNLFAQMIREEDGQGMVEYGLIIAGVALAVVALLFLFGDQIAGVFQNISDELPAAP